MELNISDGWHDRYESVINNGSITALILPHFGDDAQLSNDEWVRFKPKLKLVKTLAEKMAWNMLKGTLKYTKETSTLKGWSDFGLDDSIDSLLYQMLLRDKMLEEGLL